jgi:hypothetical protein
MRKSWRRGNAHNRIRRIRAFNPTMPSRLAVASDHGSPCSGDLPSQSPPRLYVVASWPAGAASFGPNRSAAAVFALFFQRELQPALGLLSGGRGHLVQA